MGEAICSGPGYFTYPMLGWLSNEAIGKLGSRELAELVKDLMWEVQVVEMGNGDGVPVVCYPPGDPEARELRLRIAMDSHLADEELQKARRRIAAFTPAGKPLEEFASPIEHYTLKPRSLASRVARRIGRGMGMC